MHIIYIYVWVIFILVACDPTRSKNKSPDTNAPDPAADSKVDADLARQTRASNEWAEEPRALMDASLEPMRADASVSTLEQLDSTVDSIAKAPNVADGVIQYTFSWDISGIDKSRQTGWAVANDVGYDVFVESAYLITYQSSLVPCNETGHRAPFQPWYQKLLDGILPSAHAGHGALDDQSALQFSFAESLTELESKTVEISLESSHRYCDIHYLVSPADVGTENIPNHIELDSLSLVVIGHWSHPEHGAQNPLDVRVDIAYGILQSSVTETLAKLMDRPIELGPALPGVEIRIVRHLKTIFDGILFDQFTPRAIGRRILRNLVTQAHLEVTR